LTAESKHQPNTCKSNTAMEAASECCGNSGGFEVIEKSGVSRRQVKFYG